MENASKALLISGSILIAILLIAMGVKVLDSAEGTVDSANTIMTTTEVAMFNNKFTPYLGANKSKSDVMSFVNVVVASNANSENKIVITVIKDGSTIGSTTGGSSSLMYVVGNLSPTKKYTIDLDESSEAVKEGYLHHIRITEQP